jgi:hypothetical protein
MRTIDQAIQNFTGASDNVVALPAGTIEDEINTEHRLARQSADTAIQHAIRCGELLGVQKAKVGHGQFNYWIKTHCDFERSTATRYMQAARQNATGVAISNLRGLFPSGRKPPDTRKLDFDDDHHDDDHHDDDPENSGHGEGDNEAALEPRTGQRTRPQRCRRGGKFKSPDGLHKIGIDDAIAILEPIPSQRQIVSRFRGWRSKVGKLRKSLLMAEEELFEAEATLIMAAFKHKWPS